MTERAQSRDGAIVPAVLDYTPKVYAGCFRDLADHIENGRVTIHRLEITKAGKGGPGWLVSINLTDAGGKPL
jgi:hypothetical protein